MSNISIFLHDRNPSLLIPQNVSATNVLSDFANGSHVLILLFDLAFNSLMVVHVRKLLSHMPLCPPADNFFKDFAKGSHVVIFGLSSACRCTILVHNCNPLSDIPHSL